MPRFRPSTATLVGVIVLAVAGSVAPATAAPPVGERGPACVVPAGRDVAAARTTRWQGRDHRSMSAAEKAAIARRTRQVLAAKDRLATTGQARVRRRTGGAIPVYVHVMSSRSGDGDVSGQQIQAQIDVLNATFGGAEAPGVAADTGFRFALADVDRFDDGQWHRDRQSSLYRSQTRRGGAAALNVWVVGFNDLGIATFPWDYLRSPNIDGVRVHYDSLPGGRLPHYGLGKTLTHEVGHWLGLYHTFDGGCTETNDEVSDTPAQAAPTVGCPVGADTCALPGADPVNNYMDYSYDSCYTGFTGGQTARMRQLYGAYRS